MKFYKFFSIIFFITIVAVIYVYQQVEIIKLGYNIEKNKQYLSLLNNKNADLMYCLSKLESPKNLLRSLDLENIRFAKYNKQRSNVYKISSFDYNNKIIEKNIFNKFLDVFTLTAEARDKE